MTDYLQSLHIDLETLHELTYRLSLCYRQLASNSSNQFLPTPVTHLPTGREKGQYLAVYVGLKFLRVAFIDLLGDQKLQGSSSVRRTLEKAWLIEDHLRRDHASALFHWIGDCIAEVVADRLANPGEDIFAELKIGISLCLPIKQKSVHEAILMPTGKGLALKSDLNLLQALLEGYERHTWSPDENRRSMPTKRRRVYRLPTLKLVAISNDTIATFVSLAYSIRSLPNTRVVMGLILGAGCNSAVLMKFSDFHKPEICDIRTKDPTAAETLVSTEWTHASAMGPLIELDIVTEWDRQLDIHSSRPGFQPLEYMVGGKYIGELVRIICYDWFCSIMKLPHSMLPLKLVEEYSLSTEFVPLTVASSKSDTDLANKLSKELPPPLGSDWKWTCSYAHNIRAIAWMVQNRAAALVAAAVIGLLVCTGEIKMQKPTKYNTHINTVSQSYRQEKTDTVQSSSPGWNSGPVELVVAYSGGVMQHYPLFRETVQRYIDRLIIRVGPQEEGRSVILREATDGGIIGTGVLAGIVSGEIKGIIGSA